MEGCTLLHQAITTGNSFQEEKFPKEESQWQLRGFSLQQHQPTAFINKTQG